jgi:regulator of cell morphogenesis and NO signaling
MNAARPPAPADTASLLDHVLTHFHEAHRRDLPALLALARALPASPQTEALAAHVARFGLALEAHMFKEEMRLFPMMEQGGNTLIARLIDDMHREHRQHEAAVDDLQRLRTALPSDAAHAAADFDAALARLLADLSAHVRAEDDDLFPRFLPAAAAH